MNGLVRPLHPNITVGKEGRFGKWPIAFTVREIAIAFWRVRKWRVHGFIRLERYAEPLCRLEMDLTILANNIYIPFRLVAGASNSLANNELQLSARHGTYFDPNGVTGGGPEWGPEQVQVYAENYETYEGAGDNNYAALYYARFLSFASFDAKLPPVTPENFADRTVNTEWEFHWFAPGTPSPSGDSVECSIFNNEEYWKSVGWNIKGEGPARDDTYALAYIKSPFWTPKKLPIFCPRPFVITGSFIGPWYMGNVVETNLVIEPSEYWEYANADGKPMYDKYTGAAVGWL